MKQDLMQQALELSQRIVEEWFGGNSELFSSYLGETVSWIGSVESQFYTSKEDVLKGIEKASAQVIPCTMSEQLFFIADSGVDYCLCVGRYICTLDQPGMFMSEPQRVSILWKKVEDDIRITHLHLSNTMAAVASDEEFPIKASRHNYEYVKSKLRGSNELISFETTNRIKIILNKYEVHYIKASKDYIMIYARIDECYRVHAVFTEFVEKYFSDFIKIHRSIVVNPIYLITVKEGKAILENGVILPIARGRLKDIKELFYKNNDDEK